MAAEAAASLVLLSTGTAIPTPRRGPSGAVMDLPGHALLIDPGPGALQRACTAGFPLDSIREVLLTHHHPDHCLDLAALLFARRNPLVRDTLPPLLVRGGPGTSDLVRRLAHVFGPWVEPDAATRVEDLAPGRFVLGSGTPAAAVAMDHTRASLGYRFELADGFVLAWSGDTGECEAAVELGRGADLYVLEASLPDGEGVPLHLTPGSAARIARDAAARHLVLSHLYPPVDPERALAAARAVFPGRVTVAEDGLRLPLCRCGDAAETPA